MRMYRLPRALIFFMAMCLGFTQTAFAQQIITTHSNGTSIGSIDPATGAGTNIGTTGQTGVWALAIDTDGTWFTTYEGSSTDAQLAIVDPASGTIASTIGGLGTSIVALEIDATGQMWGVGHRDQNLYRIDKATGATTLVGSTGLDRLMDLSTDRAGVLYATVANNLYTLNTETGASVLVTAFTGVASGEIMGIMHDASDNMFATAYVASSPLYAVNAATGAATVVGATGLDRPHGGDIDAFAPLGSSTPVPALPFWTLWVLASLAGLLGANGLRNRP